MSGITNELARFIASGAIVNLEPCGSRITCAPAPIDTDQDYLVELDYRQSSVSDVINELGKLGYRWEGSEHYQDAAGNFMSWRRDDVNLIVTANPAFAARHRTATRLCTRLNLLDKGDRIALFQAVLYGNDWNGDSLTPVRPVDDEAMA